MALSERQLVPYILVASTFLHMLGQLVFLVLAKIFDLSRVLFNLFIDITMKHNYMYETKIIKEIFNFTVVKQQFYHLSYESNK